MRGINWLIGSITLCSLCVLAVPANAAVTVGVDPNASWLGYMNVFELPENGGGYVFGSGWGTADLSAKFEGGNLTLAPNTSIARDEPLSNTFWWKPDGTGNKTMAASFYVEDVPGLSGEEVTFSGSVLGNTLVAPYTVKAFVKDFAPDYSSFNASTFDITGGAFSVTLQTAAGAGRHVQYGFETVGPNARIEMAAQLGSMRIAGVSTPVVPEPSSMALLATGALGLLARRRNRKA